MELLKNQIDYYIERCNNDILSALDDLAKKDLSQYDFKCKMARLEGELYALKEVQKSSNKDEKMREIRNANSLLKEKLQINFLDKNDPNIELFHFYCGAINKMLVLQTVYTNPLSACPINKEFLLSKALEELKIHLENSKKMKDKKKLIEINQSIKITQDLYNKNLKQLQNEQINS